MLLEEDFIKYLSRERLKPYLELAGGDFNIATELYSWNVTLSENFYTPLCYFEVVLRNICNEKLRKELGDYWFYDKKLLSGNNPKKSRCSLGKIKEAKAKILEFRNPSYSITNGDMVSSLQFGFWVNLFRANYEHKIWKPYLKYVFPEINRGDLFEIVNNIRKIRNRVFHYEQILLKYDLEKEYEQLLRIIGTMSQGKIIPPAKSILRFNELLKKYKEYKENTRAVR
jgi:hypothetical protein